MQLHGIDIPEDQIAAMCVRHGVKNLWVFGSILREDFGPDSDVDFLVEFQPGVRYSLLDLGGMWMDLRDIIGRDVDLKTPAEVSRLIRQDVLREARRLYAA